jgi:predicted CxxxxCH...CXXCH cytochrome family protein
MRHLMALGLVAALAGLSACDKLRPSLDAPDAAAPQVPTGDPLGGAEGPWAAVRVAACTACHGQPDLQLANADPLVAVAPPRALLSEWDPGAHRAHLVDGPFRRAVECASCHLVPTAPKEHVAQAQGKVTFSRLATSSWSGSPVAPAWNGATCSGTYCHGNFKNGSNATLAWSRDVTVACGSCHAVSPTNGPGGTHPTFSSATTCGACHGGSYTNTSVDLALHMNGKVDAGNLACSTCHGDATRVPVASATALDPSGANLVKAAPPRDAGHGPAASGAHLAHVNQGDAAAPGPLSTAVACSACHTVPSTVAHSDGSVRVVFGGLSTAGGAVPAAYDLGTHTCASTYCHGNFAGGAGANALSWTTTGKRACNSCHGAPPGPASATVHHPPNAACGTCHPGYTATTVAAATHVDGTVNHVPASGCTQCHGDLTAAGVASTDVRAAPASNASAVDAHGNASTATASRGVGAHAKHLTGTTWRSAAIACSECHAVPATGDVAHANGAAAVAFGPLARTAWTGEPAIAPAWNGVGGATNLTCSGTYCHGNFKNGANAAPTWAAPSTVTCGSCHAASTANGPGGTHPTLAAGQTCGSCHGGTYTNTTVDKALHMNGVVDGGGHPAGWKEPDQHGLAALGGLSPCTTCHIGFGPSGAASSSCDGCHATPSVYGPYATGTYPNHTNWQTECTFCHGGRNGDVTGAPPRNTHVISTSTIAQPTTDATIGAHASHVSASHALSVPLDCTACHQTRWSNATDPGHLDKATADVFFNNVGASTNPGTYVRPGCSSTYCHGNFTGGVGSAAVQWTGTFGGALTLSCGTSCHRTPPGPASATLHHPPNAVCASCHAGYTATTVNAPTHVDGAVQHAPATGCTQCHGDLTASGVASTDVRAAPASNASAVDAHGNAAAATSARGVGAHAKHLTGTAWRSTPITCAECHAVPAAGDVAHANGNPAIAFGALARTAWSGQPAITPVWNGAGGAANLTCSSTYCHGAFKNGASAAPTWAAPSAVACGSCHAVSATNGAGGTHPTFGAGQTCGSCHGGAYTNTAVDPALHLNGALDVTNLTCSSCHGDGARAPVASATGLDFLGANLVKASPPVDAGHGAAATGAHLAHVNQGDATAPGALSNALACASCHAVPTSTAHSNGTVEVAFGGLSTTGGAVPTAYNLTTHTCASTYCHGNFAGGAGANAVVWTTTGKLGCTSCHASPPPASTGHPQNDACAACHGAGYSKTGPTSGTVAAATHVNGIVEVLGGETCVSCHGTAGRASVAGADPNQAAAPPSDSTGLQASTAVGAHLAHVNQSRPTPLSRPVACAVCHPVPTQNRHANGTSQVTFTGLAVTGGIANASYASPTCSATYCHGNFTGGAGVAAAPAWSSTGAQLACNACHGAPPGPASATVHHPPNAGCVSCHAGYTATTVAAATHVNGTIEHTPASGCTQCHGDLSASAVANTDVRAAPAVNVNAVDAHGNAAATTSARGVGAHAKHLTGTTWRGTPMACTECHAVPATGDVAHANGNPAVAFGALARTAWAGQPAITPVWNGSGGGSTLTCASTYCHGAFKNGANAAPTWAAPSAVACGSCHAVSAANGPGGTHPSIPAGQNCGSCHGGAYTNTSVDPALHLNGKVDGGGESGGGTSCGSCHSVIWDAMNGSVAKATKHGLGLDVPNDDAVVWTGATLSGVVPASRSCVNMCHGDHTHDLTSPVVATHEYNVRLDASTPALRGGTTRTSTTRDNTDYDGTAASGGLCVSCHQKPVNAGHPAIGKAVFDASAHDFTSNTVGAATYAWGYQLHDGGRFLRNCTKCHASNAEGTTPTVAADGSGTGAVHYSDNGSLLSGTTNPAGTAAGFVCYNCHGSAASPADGVANANRSNRDVATAAGRAFTHPVNADAVHDSATETSAGFNSGRFSGTNRHASCLDCHSPHSAGATAINRAAAATATRNQIPAGSPLTGALGVTFTYSATAVPAACAANPVNPSTCWPATAAANYGTSLTTATREYEVCFKCHTSFAFGSTYPTAPATGASGLAQTDLGTEFNPGLVRSGHPVVAGLSSYTNSPAPKNLNATQLLPPWNTSAGTQTMLCIDCHTQEAAAPVVQGPHGSAVRFILAGANKAWPYTVAGATSGTLFKISTSETGLGTANGLFCRNCHPAMSSTASNSLHTNTNLTGGQHGGNATIPSCTGCHVRVPHGSKVSRLIVTTNAPARYKVGTPNFARFTKNANYRGYAVNTNVGSSCGQHSSGAAGGESW